MPLVITITEKANMVEVTASGDFHARSVTKTRETASGDIAKWLDGWIEEEYVSHGSQQ